MSRTNAPSSRWPRRLRRWALGVVVAASVYVASFAMFVVAGREEALDARENRAFTFLGVDLQRGGYRHPRLEFVLGHFYMPVIRVSRRLGSPHYYAGSPIVIPLPPPETTRRPAPASSEAGPLD